MPSATPSLRIQLLGQTVVRAGDVDLTHTIRPKSLSLLTLLAGSPQHSLSKDALAEMLWPNSPPDAAFLSLKVTAHYLRRALGSCSDASRDWLKTRHGVYSLGEDVWVDVDEFEECVRAARTLQTAGDVEDARIAFERAISLYGGDYLPNDSYEDWPIMTRERLRDQYLYALEQVAVGAMGRSEYARAIDCAHRLIQLDPCREDMYRLLMRAHGGLGQVARAQAWYSVAQRTVRTELDRELSSRTNAIYAEICGPRVRAQTSAVSSSDR